jgi:hypothetical protein
MTPSETAEKINRRLDRVDHDIDCAKAAIGRREAADAIRWIMRAASDKHRVLELCPPGFSAVYDMFFYVDLAARHAALWPNEDPDIDDVIEELEQSLDDVEFALDDGGYLDGAMDDSDEDAMTEALEDIASWLRDAIEGLKKNPPEKPADGMIYQTKRAYLDALDPTGELSEMYMCLDGMDLNFWFAGQELAENPPDFDGAGGDLGRAEFLKHTLMRRLGRSTHGPHLPDNGDGSNQGEDDLPPHPDHA